MSSEFDSGETMSLNGNLEVFPLEEVLRLLARSRKSGCLRVESAGVQGRVFLANGALSLATTGSDVELRRRLLSSGLVLDQDLRKIELSGASVSDSLAPEVSSTTWADFVREESVEGLYRIRRTGRGTFDFVVDLAARYPTGQTFDSEVVLSESDRRSLEWEDIQTVLPQLDRVLRMVPALGDEDSVTLSPSTWQVLAALGDGASTSQVAQKIGWSEFRTAREMTSLIRNGLISVTESAAPTATIEPADEEVAPAPEPEQEPEGSIDVATDGEGGFESEAGSEESVDEAELVSEADESPDLSIEAEEQAPEVEAVLAEVAQAEVVQSEPEAEPERESESSEDQNAGATAVESDEESSDEAETIAVGWTEPETDEAEAEQPVAAETDQEQQDEVAADEEAASSWWSDEPLSPQADDAEEPETPWGSSPWTADSPAEEPAIQSSPWGSPVSDATADDDAETGGESAESPAAEAVATEPEGERTQGWWAETMGAAEESQVGTDNEADRFLESVFSSLSEDDSGEAKPEKEEDETGFGMGLLRRRRMGAAARDISDNDR